MRVGVSNDGLVACPYLDRHELRTRSDRRGGDWAGWFLFRGFESLVGGLFCGACFGGGR